ncbi:MAG: hypothetical protein K6A29_01675, partial [Lachnospiraceae bacterium]|nr:hypothetical protein [Lachnospiraceae bacterium]
MKEENVIYRIIDGKGENRRLDRRYVFIGIFVFIMIATFSFLLTRNMRQTSAADMSQFKAGNIMSDAVMRNYASMSETEIQSFLKNKNNCNKAASSVKGSSVTPDKYNGVVYNYKYNYGGKTYFYHVENGKFVCLAGELFDGESAAHIIYQAAQDYKINPQVLIVLLEKEQGLITDQWPNSNYQYRSATGYGCPDTAACDSKYYGIKNQIRKAAELFDTVLSGGWTNYPIGWNDIRYSPTASCGSSRVYIENLATSALYRYTPYQPNAAAIKAGTGSAPCGAYGNRNFYIYFSDWFGSTQKVKYTYAQSYYNSNKNTTGNMIGATSCKTLANKEADISETGTYYCSQKFSKGGLYWVTTVNKDGSRTETGEQFLTGTAYNIYNTLTPEYRKKLYDMKVTSDNILIYLTWMSNEKTLGPIKEDVTVHNDTKMQSLHCEKASLVGDASRGYFTLPAGVFEYWTSHESLMGKPKSNVSQNSTTKMQWQEFENGWIMGND